MAWGLGFMGLEFRVQGVGVQVRVWHLVVKQCVQLIQVLHGFSAVKLEV